ncbi:MAG: 4Fe-4S dicluster domain-containing protein, partial [Betaproteobacteria bacterium]|nr:4Fe-4S dicluster domain-containing protein [Betaproteobacteria bacterium]
HVRPILNMKEDGARKMRAIAEEAAQMVQEYRGAYSGEHGDGLVRSEWIAPFFGPKLTRAFEEVKALFDPKGLMNPGKIVRPPRMDDRSLFRFKPGYRTAQIDTALDWSEWGGFTAAVEMCTNNGHCRKFDAGTMCPSYRATRDEQHSTRGRANTLRLALSGQVGPDAFTSDELYATLDLCVSCKGCKRECPTGVDMARMKIEFLHHYRKRHGLTLRDRLIAHLPRYAPWAARFRWLVNRRDAVPGVAWLVEKLVGFSSKRSLPKWRGDYFREPVPADPKGSSPCKGEGRDGSERRMFTASPPRPFPSEGERRDIREVIFFVDTFNRYFEPENAHAALAVLRAAGYEARFARPRDGGRPLCCGRTFLACGLMEEARNEARRMLTALAPHVERGIPVVGAARLASSAMLFEEFLAREHAAGRLDLALGALEQKKALVHGHCHQKAFAGVSAVQQALQLIPGLDVELIESGCCGMAGAFGYDAEHYDISMKMGEAALLPRVREAAPDALIVADGVSCRHQIRDGAGREALHVARALQAAVKNAGSKSG